tara:strand:+ start:547 stop:1731 length:1185 start_codon:yes stop_codon:yes gene_type:complete
MAINYESYVRNYGGANATNTAASAGAGIAKAFQKIPNTSDKINLAANDVITETFLPMVNVLQTDPSMWDTSYFNIQDPGTAYLDFENSLTERQKRVGKRKGLLDVTGFIKGYNTQLNALLPAVEMKLKDFMIGNNFDKEDMQRYVAKNPGLKKLLSKSSNAEVLGWTQDFTTFGDMKKNIADALTFKNLDDDMSRGDALKTMVGAGAIPAYALYSMRKKGVFDKANWRKSPMGSKRGFFTPGKGGIRGTAEALLKPGETVRNIKSKQLLDEARSKYTSMKKVHGGPGVKTQEAKDLKNQIKNLETKTKGKSFKKPQNFKETKKLWSRLTAKYGSVKKIGQALIKKVGPAKAAWLMARIGIGGTATLVPEALSTAIGVAMTGYTIYEIANALLGE